MSTDEHFMGMALEEAGHALRKGLLPVGAIIAQHGKVVARSHKNGEAHFSLDHAEHNGLRELYNPTQGKLEHVVVYSTLEPCIMCLGLMIHLRVERIVYALEDPYGGGTHMIRPDTLPVRHTKTPPFLRAHLRREESKALFRKFFLENTSGSWANKDNPLVRLCLS